MFQHHTVVTVIRTGYGWQTSETLGYRCLFKMFRSCLRTRSGSKSSPLEIKNMKTKFKATIQLAP